MVINNSSNRIQSDILQNLDAYFDKGDIIVVNQSATIPSSLTGRIMRTNEEIEIRLAGWEGMEFTEGYDWKAITFGKGNWKEKTEERFKIEDLIEGDIVTFRNGLFLTVEEIIVYPAKLIRIEFQRDIPSEELWRKIYEIGKPIQYSYLETDLDLWDQQTIFSGPPLSLEPPSASFQFSWAVVNKLIRKGIRVVPILHSAGISSTGNKEVDTMLPFPEKYFINEETATIINKAKERGGKVIALGTSVVRALESNAISNNGKIVASTHITDFVISKEYKPQIVSGLISGMHVPEESHMQILLAFSDEELLIDGYNFAIENDFLWHEYGDLTLIF